MHYLMVLTIYSQVAHTLMTGLPLTPFKINPRFLNSTGSVASWLRQHILEPRFLLWNPLARCYELTLDNLLNFSVS